MTFEKNYWCVLYNNNNNIRKRKKYLEIVIFSFRRGETGWRVKRTREFQATEYFQRRHVGFQEFSLVHSHHPLRQDSGGGKLLLHALSFSSPCSILHFCRFWGYYTGWDSQWQLPLRRSPRLLHAPPHWKVPQCRNRPYPRPPGRLLTPISLLTSSTWCM